MTKPFRFGIQIGELPADTWRDQVRSYEEMGFSTLFIPDHFGRQVEPIAALAAVAGASEKLNVGSLVLDVDYRHPVVLAKSAATLDGMSGGRFEFGFGAGWMETDYVQAGIPYDRPGVRIDRMEEALAVMKAMWTENPASFEGKHYQVKEVAGAFESVTKPHPKILIGGGGPRLLRVAGRQADIIGLTARLTEGRITKETATDLTAGKAAEKVGWASQSAADAGRDPDDLEFQTLVFVVALLDDPSPIRSAIASTTGLEDEEIANCPMFLTGPPSEIRDRLIKRRDETGISYTVIGSIGSLPPGTLERFAEEVIAPLAGT